MVACRNGSGCISYDKGFFLVSPLSLVYIPTDCQSMCGTYVYDFSFDVYPLIQLTLQAKSAFEKSPDPDTQVILTRTSSLCSTCN